MKVKFLTLKFDGMRKAQGFTVYPYDGGETILIQSDTRIGRVELRTGKTYLSAPRPNGAYGIHLNEMFGAKYVQMPEAELLDLKKYLWENSGMNEAVKGVLYFENAELYSEAK